MKRKALIPTVLGLACLLPVFSLGAAQPDAAAVTEEAAEPVTSAQPAISVIEVTGDAANYWPRWRGPSGQGIVGQDYDYPHEWSAEQNVLWKVEVPGRDSSSPIVWGDKIFLLTAETEGDDRTRSILAFNTTEGELLWRAEAPAPDEQPTRRRTDRSISSAATDGERVYAYLGAHGLMAADFEGNMVWHRKLGTFDHATSSPLIVGKNVTVVQVRPNRRGSVVYTYDRETGHLKWLAKRDEMFASGTPIAIRVGEQEQIVVSAQQYVRAYDAKSGDEVWNAMGNTNNAIPTPVVGFGMVFVTSGPRGDTMAYHANGKKNVTRTHKAWKAKETGPTIPSPIFYDGYLFLLNDAMGSLTCFDAATGDVIWDERIVDTRSGGLTASPVLVDGTIFVTDVGGSTHRFEAGPEFKFLGTNRLNEEVRASPALSEGVWYFRTKRHLIAIASP